MYGSHTATPALHEWREVWTITFLDYVICQGGMEMDSNKVWAVTDWLLPAKVKELQCFLKFENFYWQLIWNYSSVVSPSQTFLGPHRSQLKSPWNPENHGTNNPNPATNSLRDFSISQCPWLHLSVDFITAQSLSIAVHVSSVWLCLFFLPRFSHCTFLDLFAWLIVLTVLTFSLCFWITIWICLLWICVLKFCTWILDLLPRGHLYNGPQRDF